MRFAVTMCLFVLSTFAFSGCDGKSPSGSGGASKSSPGIEPLDVQVAKTLTEEKMVKYIAYEKEMIPSLAIVSQMMAGSSKSGKSISDMAKDPRAKAMEDAQNAACKKVGLEPSDIPGFTKLTAEYYAQAGVSVDAQKQLETIRQRAAEAKAAGKAQNPVDAEMEKLHADIVAKMDETRKKYEPKYGKAVVDILRKHEAEYAEINSEKIKAFIKASAEK